MGIGKNEFKSNNTVYETPQILFDLLNNEFNFTLDICASDDNHKCDNYFTVNDNALNKSWIGNCWLNPPFGKFLGKYMTKLYEEQTINGGIKVGLTPVRSNTIWWAKIINNAEIRFINGEVNFNNEKRGLWLPICILIFGSTKPKTHSVIDYRKMRKIYESNLNG